VGTLIKLSVGFLLIYFLVADVVAGTHAGARFITAPIQQLSYDAMWLNLT